MERNNEIRKIKEAFGKVKIDIDFVNDRVNTLNNTKTNKTELQYIYNEIEKIKSIIISQNIEKSNKKDCHTLDILGNLDSKKVHLSNCPFARKITEEHKIVFNDINEAINHKYSRCSCIM